MAGSCMDLLNRNSRLVPWKDKSRSNSPKCANMRHWDKESLHGKCCSQNAFHYHFLRVYFFEQKGHHHQHREDMKKIGTHRHSLPRAVNSNLVTSSSTPREATGTRLGPRRHSLARAGNSNFVMSSNPPREAAGRRFGLGHVVMPTMQQTSASAAAHSAVHPGHGGRSGFCSSISGTGQLGVLSAACTVMLLATFFTLKRRQWAMAMTAAVAPSAPDLLSQDVESAELLQCTTSGPRIKVARIRVSNLHCEQETRLVMDTLQPRDGVRQVVVNSIGRLAIVRYDASAVSINDLVGALNRYKLGCSIQDNGDQASADAAPRLQPVHAAHFVLLGATLAAAAYLTLQGAPPEVARAVLFTYLVLATPPLVQEALRGLFVGRVDLSLLILVAMGSAVALGDVWDAVLVVALSRASKAFEEWVMRTVRGALEGAHAARASTAALAEPGKGGARWSWRTCPSGRCWRCARGSRSRWTA